MTCRHGCRVMNHDSAMELSLRTPATSRRHGCEWFTNRKGSGHASEGTAGGQPAGPGCGLFMMV